MKHKILDSARNLTILKQDLGMLPKPRPDWNTIVPVEGGHYIANGVEYVYTLGELVEYKEEKTDRRGRKL
jgi:hypothetical protein